MSSLSKLALLVVEVPWWIFRSWHVFLVSNLKTSNHVPCNHNNLINNKSPKRSINIDTTHLELYIILTINRVHSEVGF